MAYLIAIVMTLSVLEGHSPIANFLKCDIWHLGCIVHPQGLFITNQAPVEYNTGRLTFLLCND